MTVNETLAQEKQAMRAAAFARRKLAHEQGGRAALDAATNLLNVLAPHHGKVLAGYMAMRTEIDPHEALKASLAHHQICMPVVMGKDQPLQFRAWTDTSGMETGAFGALIPASGAWLEPEIVIVPLVAFDRMGGRLGYGGGFYDRSLEQLRAKRQTLAIGFAYAAQESEDLPLEPTDQPLDFIVTEHDIFEPSRKAL